MDLILSFGNRETVVESQPFLFDVGKFKRAEKKIHTSIIR